MGTYVYFNRGRPDGIESRVLSDIAPFTHWFSSLAEEFPDEYPPALLNKVLDIKARGRSAMDVASDEEAHLVDRAVDEYWGFCMDTGRLEETDITPSAHKRWRYADELSDVIPDASDNMRNAYRRLFSGRSLARFPGHAYRSEDGISHLSWLLPDESVQLRNALLPHEARLMRASGDAEAGVIWILQSLHEVTKAGQSLIVTVA